MNDIDNHSTKNDYFLDKRIVSACGLYCGACGIYLATQENELEKLLQYALVLNQSVPETYCNGCGADKKSAHCSKICSFIKCTRQKNIEFCGECIDFPCEKLIDFQSKSPHRIEIIKSQKRLMEIGWEQWLIEHRAKFTCVNCNTINSAYHVSCRKCGNTPSCEFTLDHRATIEKYLLDE